jgi:hypothetical protein
MSSKIKLPEWCLFAVASSGLLLVLPGCSGSGSPPTEPPPKHAATLTIVGGNNQTGTMHGNDNDRSILCSDSQLTAAARGAEPERRIGGSDAEDRT